jgi:multiple sugar transport system ATP-binding protein
MAHVSLNNVGKTFPGGIRAVQAVSLEVDEGEFLVLVGPSGCGKSTVLRMVAGLEEISEGTIKIDGRVVNDVAPKDRDIAMVFQNYALYPHMTVFDNMAFALRRRRIPRAEVTRRVHDAATTLGIVDVLARKPGALSGGQRQRVAVGRAIVREPKAFLFDEPLSNLDARLRLSTRTEIKALHLRLRTTSIYVTHDQEEAMTLGDRVAVMSRGTVQQVDTPLNVYHRPLNRFVAAFMGTVPMNFLDGALSRAAGGLVFEEGSSDAVGRAYRLRVSPAHAGTLAPHVGKRIVLGLRPRAFRESSGGPLDGERDGRAWELPVRVVEPLGDAIDVFCSTPRHQIMARVPSGVRVAPGGTVVLAPDMDEAHYFEPGEFGRSLLTDDARPIADPHAPPPCPSPT